MSEAQLAFLNGPTFRGLWVSNIEGVRRWTVTWCRDGEFLETIDCVDAGDAIDHAILNEAGEWFSR